MVGPYKKEYETILDQLKPFQLSNASANPRLIAVSKKQPVEKITQLHQWGQVDFAENYLQEALDKQDRLSHLPLNWHFIGTIQSKKIKDMVGRFHLIHSVSRYKEAEAISQQATQKNLIQPILMQVNIANEPSKSGFAAQDMLEMGLKIQQLPGLSLAGMMVFPPLEDSEADTNQWFVLGQKLYKSMQSHIGPAFQRLSMGTSQDYLLALSHGATDIRVGERLFGSRD
jgi:PLP dependent protein